MKSLQIIVLVLLALCSENASGDYYSSVASLHDLLEVELFVMTLFEKYMNGMEEITEEINEKINELESIAEEADDDFYENPLDAYKIISRFVIDWKYINKTVFNEAPAQTYISNITALVDKDGYELPTIDELIGASRGVALLQRIYRLETREVAKGNLKGINYADEMTASDCYWLGYSLKEAGNYKYAAEWLLQARLRLAEELKVANGTREHAQITDVQVLLALAHTMYYLGKNKLALLFTDELLAQDPQNTFGRQHVPIFSRKAHEERQAILHENVAGKSQSTKISDPFERVCNGELQRTPREERKLRCRYVHNNVPFRYIGPFKKEELNHDPPVAYYHDIITENEIESILNVSVNSVERSLVGQDDERIVTDWRTSKNTWLYYKDHPFLKKLAQRLVDITGLILKSAEPLQVANYGLGGQYGSHYDFTEHPKEDYGEKGNRLLTALIYLTDVEIGGATGFPLLKFAARPLKRSMIVWYNLHKSLEPDYRTLHGGCPVLIGSKWICNELFHDGLQEFTRPCGLERDDYKSLEVKELLKW